MDKKTILITGAEGSIGSKLCRQLTRFNPARLILLDASEQTFVKFKQNLCTDLTLNI